MSPLVRRSYPTVQWGGLFRQVNTNSQTGTKERKERHITWWKENVCRNLRYTPSTCKKRETTTLTTTHLCGIMSSVTNSCQDVTFLKVRCKGENSNTYGSRTHVLITGLNWCRAFNQRGGLLHTPAEFCLQSYKGETKREQNISTSYKMKRKLCKTNGTKTPTHLQQKYEITVNINVHVSTLWLERQ